MRRAIHPERATAIVSNEMRRTIADGDRPAKLQGSRDLADLVADATDPDTWAAALDELSIRLYPFLQSRDC